MSSRHDDRSHAEAARPAAIEIDWTRCDGHGLCHALLPTRIDVDEWGFPVLGNGRLAPSDETAARRAIAACPALALRLAPAP